ncbi:membrane protein [Catellatospora methionotrophica]|uniref:Membrane protein n=1 Tax=Catellatospora methionotrophica TaxID=121620 RepID=A0A8J3KZ95_9ACTN|nr:zf-HC2 domain-containing protein [Catellatospora methionotrophica]GIG11697.1 membrane protein [Catellatospora methionotrophica]
MGEGTSHCDTIRDMLSARLDGEELPGERETTDAHLDACATCATWWRQASAITRLIRTTAALPSPPLSPGALGAVLTAAPPPPPSCVPAVLRTVLLAVGLAQFLLGAVQISALARLGDDHEHAAIGSVSSGHLWHESAAWNIALGAALAWLAWRRVQPATLLPVMTAFVAVLGLLTANDALTGRVDGSRVVSHSLVFAGYLLLLALNLPRWRDQPPARRATPPVRWSIHGTDDADTGPLAPVYPLPVRTAIAHTAQQVAVRHREAA